MTAEPPAGDPEALLALLEELKRSEARLAQAQEVARVGSWDFDLRTGKGVWSAEMYRLLEFDPAEGLPTYERFKARLHPDDVARHAAMEQIARTTGDPRDFDLRVLYSDGSQAWLHALGRSEKDENGRVVRTFGTLMDITERKMLEQRLRESEKMEGIGRLAGGIAHDFNNLLCVIMGYVELIEEELPQESALLPQIRLIGDAADRASNLTRQLLSFARRQPSEPKIVSVNAEIVQILEILRPLIREDILLATHLCPGIGNVRIDSHHLEQIIVNLVVNARDAMPDGGTLTIRTADALIDAQASLASAVLTPGAYILISVSDTGAGMSEEVKSRIFEPFFSTKEMGKGTGLGLASVYGIIKQNNGSITVLSEPGQGSTFCIYLPRVEGEAQSATLPSRSLTSLRGAETVLVVEDEPVLREMIVLALHQNGYAVLHAENGVEALRVAKAYTARIDLLITDAIMPHMGSHELAARLRQSRPDIRVLVASGYSDDHLTETPPLFPGTAFLAKPFTSSTLLEKVRMVMANS